MNITDEIKSKIKQDSLDSTPREACGFVIEKENKALEIYKCLNVSNDPENQFRIRVRDYLIAEDIGEVIGLYHSHTKGDKKFSEADTVTSNNLELINLLYITEEDEFHIYYPKIEE